jgi:hypothetical protein
MTFHILYPHFRQVFDCILFTSVAVNTENVSSIIVLGMEFYVLQHPLLWIAGRTGSIEGSKTVLFRLLFLYANNKSDAWLFYIIFHYGILYCLILQCFQPKKPLNFCFCFFYLSFSFSRGLIQGVTPTMIMQRWILGVSVWALKMG